MKVCQVVSHIDQEASGPSYSVPRLSKAIASCGHLVTLATLARGLPPYIPGVEHLAFEQSRFLLKLGRSRMLEQWLLKASSLGFQLIHTHGLWMMPNIYPYTAMRRTGIPYIISPRGTLDPAALSYSKLAKMIVWNTGQGRALRNANALHATSEQEVDHIRRVGIKAPIFLSPNGVDIPDLYRPKRKVTKTLLYLGRLHEKKGLDMLIDAWERIYQKYPDWELKIVGKGAADFEDWLRARVNNSSLDRIKLESAVYGEEKLNTFRSADLFILPTRGENFGMVVAEALAAGTPVITTTSTPWSNLVSNGAGWCCQANTSEIKNTLIEALSVPSNLLEEMGGRGRSWMDSSFSWENIGEQISEGYHWLLSGGSKPGIVIID